MLFISFNPTILILECCIVFLAFVVRGFCGFGAGLFMTPLLTFFLDLKHAVVISVLLQLVGGGCLTAGTIKASDRNVLCLIMIPSCLASILGVYVLTVFNLTLLLLILGAVTFIFSVRMFILPLKQYMNKIECSSFSTHTLIGAASGLLHGLYGAGGVPIVLFLSNKIPVKSALRATLLIYFLILDILLAFVYLLFPIFFAGKVLLDLKTLGLEMLLLIPTFGGAWIGYLLQQRVSEIVFRRSVAFILILTSLLLMQKGLGK